jgi:signal transduction histidine kinase
MGIRKFFRQHNPFSGVSKIGAVPGEDDESRIQRRIWIITSILISIAALLWSLMYFLFGQFLAGMIPLLYTFLSVLSLVIFRISGHFRLFRFTQIILILILPFLLMVVLGGFINASAVILWALLAPVGALLSGQLRQAVYWFLAFLLLVLISGFLQPFVAVEKALPGNIITLFFILNICAVSFITFLVLNSFVKQKDKVIQLVHKNRELEVHQLEQEVVLRQSEKLATLGKLSAGIAHELNNPAAATQRGSDRLYDTMTKLQDSLLDLTREDLSQEQTTAFNQFRDRILDTGTQGELSALDRSDREQEIGSWLEQQGIPDAWDIAPMLAGSGIGLDDIKIFSEKYSKEKFSKIIWLIHTLYTATDLLGEIRQGTARITEIIKSLKSYSYQEEAPLQSLDIHEGINDTLVMFRSKLKKGITVVQAYDKTLPRIQGYASELTQVWTNLIDNAITAMDGQGKLTINTSGNGKYIVVRITDTGGGIPEDIQKKIFDPFFTTKPPGEGTGLGLNISRDIIVARHGGKIRVFSEPGKTCFEVKLPMGNGEPEGKDINNKNNKV